MVRGAAVDNGAVQVNLWPRRGRWGDVVVTEVGGDDESWCGSRFLTQASDGDRGIVEDTSVEGGRAAFKETLDLATCSQGCPSSTGALEGEALGEGLRCAAAAGGQKANCKRRKKARRQPAPERS